MVNSRILIIFSFITICLFCFSCKKEPKENLTEELAIIEPEQDLEFGFNLNDYIVKRDTIQKGDSFGQILQRNSVSFSEIFKIAEKSKDTFDIRKLQVGKPYTLLCKKGDSLEKPNCFIYQPNKEDYVVINFEDSIHAYTSSKPLKYVEKEIAGVITTNISEALDEQGVSVLLAYKLADEIFPWTIDFRRLQKGDRFKVIYTDKYIEDSIYGGVQDVKAAYFEHNNEPFYAFEFETDSIKGIRDYFNEEAKNLRRAFLKAPVQFSRISSRYNLKRRIAYYGNKVRPHRGTDFAAAIGTPILATANGTVIESTRRRGNGKFVKIRHNATYQTQYLHMKAQNVKKGQFVKQGDVIGWIGMTGNSGGPHVCYRFWKNGKEVDPFKQKLPEAEPISDSLKTKYLEFIKPIKIQLDSIQYKTETLEELLDANLITQANN